jgi:hypothetical protein
VNSIRPRCSPTDRYRSAAFSASSRLAGLSGEISTLRNRNSSATITPDGYVIPSLDQHGRRFRYTQVMKGRDRNRRKATAAWRKLIRYAAGFLWPIDFHNRSMCDPKWAYQSRLQILTFADNADIINSRRHVRL